MLVERLEDLLIHQIALQLAKEVHELVGAIPFNWKIKEVDDIKRSSSSVSSNISEGFSQRFYTKKFLLYLYIALGSSDETQDHLKKLYNNGHINSERASYYINSYKNLSIKILNLINYQRKRHNIRFIPQNKPQ